MAISTFAAAKKICELSDWTITNLKLQKILYLAYRDYYGENDKPLIAGEFEAWKYGPVISALYDHVKMFGDKPIINRFYNIEEHNDDSTEEMASLSKAWQKYGSMEGWELVQMTHTPEGAWSKNYNPDQNCTIPNKDIKEEY
jgi:uncharacterized phage-associated protein